MPSACFSSYPMEHAIVGVAGRCECLYCDLNLLLFSGERFGKLLEDNSSFAGVSTSFGMMGSFPLSRVVGCLA